MEAEASGIYMHFAWPNSPAVYSIFCAPTPIWFYYLTSLYNCIIVSHFLLRHNKIGMIGTQFQTDRIYMQRPEAFLVSIFCKMFSKGSKCIKNMK